MDFAGVVIGHFMFVGLLSLLVFIGMTGTDTVFASAGIDIIVTGRAVGHIGIGCIVACIAHIVKNQAAVGWLLRRDASCGRCNTRHTTTGIIVDACSVFAMAPHGTWNMDMGHGIVVGTRSRFSCLCDNCAINDGIFIRATKL